MSMTIADVNGDLDLDLYITIYRTSTIQDELETKRKGRTVYGTPTVVGVNGKSLAESNFRWPNSSRSQSYNVFMDAKTIVISQLQGPKVVD